jgi:hypothetical protein
MSIDPEQLANIPATGKVQVPLQDLPASIKVSRGLPPHLMIQFDQLITPVNQKCLQKCWDNVLASSTRHQPHKCDLNHSNNNTAFHFGIWKITSSEPHLTAETTNQTPQAITAIDTLLRFIGDFIAGKICSVFGTHAPEQWDIMQK